MIGIRKGIRKNIRRCREAGIEGLPLQLMVMVLVAGLGTSVIMGWMGSIDIPESIDTVECTPGEVVISSTVDGIPTVRNLVLTIIVMDQDGNPISDALVVLEGANVRTSSGGTVYGRTGLDGKVAFTGVSVSLVGADLGYITVTVTKSGYGTNDMTRIPVIVC